MFSQQFCATFVTAEPFQGSNQNINEHTPVMHIHMYTNDTLGPPYNE